MKIKCDGFILRSPKISDIGAYCKAINDPLIGKNLQSIDYPISKVKTKKILLTKIEKNKEKKAISKGFIIEVDGECAGEISLEDINVNLKARVSYWLNEKYRGKGIMTKALKTVTNYGFRRYNLKRIAAHVAVFNKPSVRILEKCGYKFEGIERNNRLKNGTYYDDYLYAITR